MISKHAKMGALNKFFLGQGIVDGATKFHNDVKNPTTNQYDQILNTEIIKKPKNNIMGVSNEPANKWASSTLDRIYMEKKAKISFKLSPATKAYWRKVLIRDVIQNGISTAAKIGTGAAVGYGVSKVLNNSKKTQEKSNRNAPKTITFDIPVDALYPRPQYKKRPKKQYEKITKVAYNANWKNFVTRKLPKDIVTAAAGTLVPALTYAGVERVRRNKASKQQAQVGTTNSKKLPPAPKGYVRVTVNLDGKQASTLLNEMYKEARSKDLREDIEKGNEKHIKEISSSDEAQRDINNAVRVLSNYDRIKQGIRKKKPILP